MNVKSIMVFFFIAVCFLTVGVFSIVAEQISDNGDEICIGSDSFCLRFYSLNEMLGYESFVSKKEEVRIKLLQDSIRKAEEIAFMNSINSLADSITMMEMIADNDSVRFWLPSNSRAFWNEIFSQWDSLKSKHQLYRILHYGDSQIEMDRMTAYVRNKLQAKFGGSGPGLVPPIQPIPATTVRQTASETWKRYISYGIPVDRANHRDYGVLGMVYYFDSGYAHAGISIRIKSDSLLNKIDDLKILTGSIENTLKVTVKSSGLKEQFFVEPGSSEQLIQTSVPKGVSSFNITFEGDTSNAILAIALDSKEGIVMDNIPWRGSSGLTFIGISRQSLKESYKQLGVQMVILQFGGNSVPYIKDEAGVLQYVKSFRKQIKHLQAVDSTLKIIVIGPGDMSYNDKGTMATYPILEQMDDQMRKVSTEAGAAYWSMFRAMGGLNSMPEWVNASPALAAPDYIHFTEKGSEVISELLYESILNEYKIYKKKTELDEEKKNNKFN